MIKEILRHIVEEIVKEMFDSVPEEVIWAILVAIIVYLVKVIWFPPPPPPPVVRRKLPTYEKRDYTLEELLEYDGKSKDKPIFVAIKGKIYDVTYKRATYGPGGDYSLFAGHDATCCLAKSSFEVNDLNRPDTTNFNQDEMESLNHWVSFFDERYDVVGHIKSSNTSESNTSINNTSNHSHNNSKKSSTNSFKSSSSSSSSTDNNKSSTTKDKVYTYEELKKYDGSSDVGDMILVAINGLVYDVTTKRAMYGPGGGYHILAGHDATACLGKNKLETEYLNQPDTSDYTPEQKQAVEKWVKFFTDRYSVVGTVSN